MANCRKNSSNKEKFKMSRKPDFSGYATRVGLKCADGRTILRDAFKECDGAKVPLVWNHQHNSVTNVLGHAILENRKDGVYAYGYFNDSEEGEGAKKRVVNGDVVALSIYANQLKQNHGDVLHGVIREVSLVLAGANPGAFIDSVMAHGEDGEGEAWIYGDEKQTAIELYHASDDEEEAEEKKMPEEPKEKAENPGNGKTVKEIFDSLTEEQKKVVCFLIQQATKGGKSDSEDNAPKEGEEVKHNAFEGNNAPGEDQELMHSAMQAIIGDAKRFGSMKESFLQHAQEYGIENIDYLFPDAKTVENRPEFIKRDTDWVQKVMSGVHHVPFSRIKSVFANITEDEARAKGYIKGKFKKEEVFPLLKRSTAPTTVYKKQKLDRDDVNDIVDFDVVAWLKTEMRMMLDEELARAYLIGDGRSTSDDDKIDESCIRPIAKMEDLFNIKIEVDPGASDEEDLPRNFIRAAIKNRKLYKGSGNPSLYCQEDLLCDMLLLEDKMGRTLFESEEQLAKKLRVKEIVPIPVMTDVLGIIVNLKDYSVGADKGGAINMFDDFDIDYNQMKYLIETRCCGSLTHPFSAMTFTRRVGG
jgi:hypothetical protein